MHNLKKFSNLFFLIVTLVATVSTHAWAAQPLKGAESNMVARIDRLAQEVDAIGKREQEILTTQDEIMSEIKNLKIITHRR